MIQVENLHKRFGTVHAVTGVTFTAFDGAVTGLLGPNGAGKTTALRMLYTLMRPDEGRILVDGVDAVADPQGARLRLGVLPDQSGLYPRLTAREHIRYFGELQGITGADLANRTEHLLKLLDMAAIAAEIPYGIVTVIPVLGGLDVASPGGDDALVRIASTNRWTSVTNFQQNNKDKFVKKFQLL